MLTILKILEKHGKTIRLMVGVLIGLVLGFIIAWGIRPVQWKDATPGQLHPAYQGYYINAIAKEYQQTGNIEIARHQLGLDLEEKANPWLKEKETLEAGFAQALEQTTSREDVITLGRLAQDLQVNFRPDVTAPEATTTPEAETPPSRSFLGNLLRVLGYLIIALAVAALLYLLHLHKREGRDLLWAVPVLMAMWANLHAGYSIGLILLPFVFYPMLAFGDATYRRPMVPAVA